MKERLKKTGLGAVGSGDRVAPVAEYYLMPFAVYAANVALE